MINETAYVAPVDNMQKTLAKNLKRLRTQRGWSQEFLAEKAEVSVNSISHTEQSLRWPEFSSIQKIAKALGVRQSLLFVEEGAPPPEPPVPEAWKVITKALEEHGLIPRAKRKRRKSNTPPPG